MTRIVQVTLCMFVLLPVMAAAEIVYVNDTLRVGIRPEPNNSVVPLSVVVTGMKLEVIERADGYLKIRTEKGVEGWIRDIYVTSEMPAQLKLAKINEQYAQVAGEAEKKEEFLRSMEKKNTVLSEELDSLKKTNSELRTELLKVQKSSGTNSTSVWYLLIALSVLVLVIGGFAAGVFWHRKQTMKRLGGLRF